MASAAISPTEGKSLKDAGLKEQLQRLRQTDNRTNWYYLLRAYAYLALVIGGSVWFHEYRVAAGWGWGWEVPVVLAAVVLVGAGQHQLSGLAHEGSHHILFRGHYLNELASDWLCMFPLFSTTHHYRLQHLAHHQFVNDPDRDPDVTQLQSSGHWLNFPVSKRQFLLVLLKQLWLPNLLRYTRARARYSAVPTDKNPYVPKGWKPSRLPVRAGVLYLAALTAALTGLVYLGNLALLAAVPAVLLAGVLGFYSLLPERHYSRSRIKPVVPVRVMTLQRMAFNTLLLTGIAWLTVWTGRPVALYFLLLWVLPILTSFSFFMVLRQLVQHGNGGRGWLTNTRVFFLNRVINFCVLPMGQDYHLPHHLFVTVPHYRLRRLHELLLEYPEYRAQAVIVEGYF